VRGDFVATRIASGRQEGCLNLRMAVRRRTWLASLVDLTSQGGLRRAAAALTR
jgi:hypothetical protein